MPSVTIDCVGKIVGNHTYIHVAALEQLSLEAQKQVSQACKSCQLQPLVDFNVIKFDVPLTSVSFLDYPDFFECPFPLLTQSWTVDCVHGTFRHRNYADSLNPPILHRKELLLPKDYPGRAVFEALTTTAEKIGLFDDTVRIGFLRSWEQLLESRGFQVVGHELVPVGNDDSTSTCHCDPDATAIARHLTALTRHNFSDRKSVV